MLGIWGWWKCSYREAGINVMFAFPEFERGMSSNRHWEERRLQGEIRTSGKRARDFKTARIK